MLDSAATEGCGSVGQLGRIVLPQRIPALGVAWLIGLALALGDLTASILVVPPGVETLSIHVFNLVHYGVEDQVAGICLALAAALGGLAAAAMWLATARLAIIETWDGFEPIKRCKTPRSQSLFPTQFMLPTAPKSCWFWLAAFLVAMACSSVEAMDHVTLRRERRTLYCRWPHRVAGPGRRVAVSGPRRRALADPAHGDRQAHDRRRALPGLPGGADDEEHHGRSAQGV